MISRHILALAAGIVFTAPLATAAAGISVSSKAVVQVIFTQVREIPTSHAAGRAGLSFQTGLSGFGYSGGSAEDAQSDAIVDLGFLGGFPDGKAPVPGTGAYIGFNPYASCSEAGDAYGIGSLYFQLALTDKTAGQSRWEVTCEITSWVWVTGSCDSLELCNSYWSATAGFDMTDANSAYEQTLVTQRGYRPMTTTMESGPAQTVTMVIQGSPETDPAQAVMNLKTEAEATARAEGLDGSVTFEWNFGIDRDADRTTK